MAKHAVLKFVAIHKQSNDQLRAGQRFCNLYIKQPWPELFHCADEEKALWMIREWLDKHHYTEELPPCLQPQLLPEHLKGTQ